MIPMDIFKFEIRNELNLKKSLGDQNKCQFKYELSITKVMI